ncbi:MAG: serine/threonine dehydratase [Candidatus Caenarcaniphilales bacterium]|nr:serine/threonine dehydratase [Candidatus Caenarcaniphilales bacterium]
MFKTKDDYKTKLKELLLKPELVKSAYDRIKGSINETPLMSSTQLNRWLGHEVFFKMECFQKVGAFKARGAMNTLLTLKDNNFLPKEVVTFSSGNHAQAVAWAAGKMGVKANILMSQHASPIKIQATKAYGANIVLCKSRKEAEETAYSYAENGAYLIPPYDHESVIAGQGTACYEALQEIPKNPNAIFVPVGGGGFLSGSYLAKKLLSSSSKIFGAEPEQANDAARSIEQGSIVKFDDSPETIADGVQTLSVSDRTFAHILHTDGIITASEDEIIYWTQWLTHLLKASIEPSCALAMASAFKWLKEQRGRKTILVMISGGNISAKKHHDIWSKDCLEDLPIIQKN